MESGVESLGKTGHRTVPCFTLQYDPHSTLHSPHLTEVFLLINVFADLHIHIGSAGDKAVKVTASRHLTLRSIILKDAVRKGLGMVGIVDCACTNVAIELEQMIETGFLTELEAGGLLAVNGLLVIPAAEIETREGVHVILYLPGLEQIKMLQKYLASRIKNMQLSTQKADVGLTELMNMAYLLDAVFCPAHVFTPHKGVYGFYTDRLSKVLGKDMSLVRTLELGLSADTDMADMLRETREMAFLSNSDAHYLEDIHEPNYRLFVDSDEISEILKAVENKL